MIASILDDARARPAVNGVRLIGVDGPSGSGKTTLARALAGAAGAPLVQCDDFVSWLDVSGWWPRFDAEVIGPLLEGRDATYQIRDWQHDELGSSLRDWKTTRAAPLVVVEGVTCTRRESRVTFRVWVEAPYDVRLRRGIERDGEDHRDLWLRWMAEEAAFFDADGTRDRADLVLSTA